MLGVERHALVLDVDVEGALAVLVVVGDERDEVADLALEGDVGDEPLHRLGVGARQVAGVRVGVGVTVGGVED